ncbi:15-hydroxyprostaglandin dehydrogenase (nad(+)) [Stemphylium lycopersici]|nr:15-hydroxyprostaglandin dehydrogenase (nad(+)) [Stemphylium lycopersici]RAR02216.1 15-hydroxyprostaglandin dehydrogenase (nad(+)) [Stemphylium lycopersici]
MNAADNGRWVKFPREIFNAFYCCIALSHHAYQWATILIVKVAQVEKEVDIPFELVEPWVWMQRHFGCASEAGNDTSNVVLKFDTEANYTYMINTGMSPEAQSGEEAFARIFYDVEMIGVRIYRDMVHAIVDFSRGDTAA